MPSPSPRLNGLLFALAAPLCWSVGGLVFRSVHAGAWEAVFWRSLGHAAVFPAILWFCFGRSAFDDLRRTLPTAIIAALCMAGTFVFHVLAMASTTVANVLVLQSTAPLLVAVFGWILLKERVEPRGWATILVAFTGLAPVVGTSLGAGRLSGDVFALAVALCSAAMVLLVRRAREFNMLPISWLAASLAVLVALPAAAPWSLTAADMSLLFLLGIVQMTAGTSFFLLALRRLPAAQVMLIALLEPVLGPLWVWLFAGEAPPPLTLLGGSIVVGALTISTLLTLRRVSRLSVQPA